MDQAWDTETERLEVQVRGLEAENARLEEALRQSEAQRVRLNEWLKWAWQYYTCDQDRMRLERENEGRHKEKPLSC